MTEPSSSASVVVRHVKEARYPLPPFHPPSSFPEFERQRRGETLDPTNEVYSAVRDILRDLALDSPHVGSVEWNPFRGFIRPGDRVVIKPNLVFHGHPLGERGIESMLTNGSVIRPLVDYAWLALDGRGEIVICDVPLQTADWEKIIAANGLRSLVDFERSRGVNVTLLDLRLERARSNRFGIVTRRIRHAGDPLGYVPVDLGDASRLLPLMSNYRRLTITDYPKRTVAVHHNPGRNEYLLARTILNADVFINVPKLKTHKKAGVTLSLKNLIGINGDKSWIAHHREGLPRAGGDESPRLHRWDTFRYRIFVGLKNSRIGVGLLTLILVGLTALERIVRFAFPRRNPLGGLKRFGSVTEGSWYGNDTLWRVILDLNRILLYSDASGRFDPTRRRRYFTLIDGVWAGERNGPMHHVPKAARTLVAGFNPVYADAVAAHLMGFDPMKIPQIFHAFDSMTLPIVERSLNDVRVVEGGSVQSYREWSTRPTHAFLPPETWAGTIEHDRRDPSDETRSIPRVLETGVGE